MRTICLSLLWHAIANRRKVLSEAWVIYATSEGDEGEAHFCQHTSIHQLYERYEYMREAYSEPHFGIMSACEQVYQVSTDYISPKKGFLLTTMMNTNQQRIYIYIINALPDLWTKPKRSHSPLRRTVRRMERKNDSEKNEVLRIKKVKKWRSGKRKAYEIMSCRLVGHRGSSSSIVTIQ